MALGGARPGAGRPKGAISKATAMQIAAKEKLIAFVEEHWHQLLAKKLELAMGDLLVVNDAPARNPDHPELNVYRAKPSERAIQELLEFAAGKATQTIDASIEGGEESIAMVDKLVTLSERINNILEKKGRTVSARKVAQPVKTDQIKASTEKTPPSDAPKSAPIAPALPQVPEKKQPTPPPTFRGPNPPQRSQTLADHMKAAPRAVVIDLSHLSATPPGNPRNPAPINPSSVLPK